MSRREVRPWMRAITEPISKDNVPASLQSYALNMSFPIEPFLYVLSHLSLCSLFFSFSFSFPFPLASSVFEKWQKSLTSGLLCPFTSHVHYTILPAIYYTSRTMRRTFSSTCGFRIIRNASSKPPEQPTKHFRRHGMKKAAF